MDTMSTVPIGKEYLALIRRFPLRPIRDEEALDLASEVFSELVLKAQNRTQDENDYLAILGKLIREYEDPHKRKTLRMTPKRALQSLMEDNKLCNLSLQDNWEHYSR
jgi:antitoxin component HigA of HigAB toxin-antitoxin module